MEGGFSQIQSHNNNNNNKLYVAITQYIIVSPIKLFFSKHMYKTAVSLHASFQ